MSPSRRLWLDGPLGQPMLLTSIAEERDGTATFLVFFFVFCFLLVLLQFRRVSLGGLASAPWGGGGHMWGGAPTRSPSSPPLPSSGVAGYTGWAVARSVRLGLASSTTCAASCGVGGLWGVCWCPSPAHGAICVLQSKGLPIKALPISLFYLAAVFSVFAPVAEW